MISAKHIIVGAGLAGLSAAYHLEKNQCDDWIILEKTDRVGGLCKSVKYDSGFTFDHSIHILYSSDPYASGLIKTLLQDNMSTINRESWVYSNGVYTSYPWQANTYSMPVKVVKECLMGVVKATYEKGRSASPANFEEWCYDTFGEGLAKHFMIPYNRKLWAIDLKKMTDAWIKDRVMTPSLDEVIEGALHKQNASFGPNKTFWYPKKSGIEALPMGFLPHLDNKKTKFNIETSRVLWKEKKVISKDAREWSYSNLISTLPLPVLARCMEPEMPSALMKAAGNLEHNTVYAINLAVKKKQTIPLSLGIFP